tara:strand:- start:8537 stop:8740 length:204 start_codon:yes stop_codon:yes gene_type:complete
MSVKELLGLEDFSISDAEIMRRLNEALSKGLTAIEFSSSNKQVVVKLRDVELDINRGHLEYSDRIYG